MLKLDASLGDEVAIVRRNLLRLTQNREFGEQAAFKVCFANARSWKVLVLASYSNMQSAASWSENYSRRQGMRGAQSVLVIMQIQAFA